MSEYELEPTQHLRKLAEERAVVADINQETLDKFIVSRSPQRPWQWWSSAQAGGQDYAILAAQISAMELTLARLDREIERLEAQIARGSEQQDPKPALDFGSDEWTFEHDQQ